MFNIPNFYKFIQMSIYANLTYQKTLSFGQDSQEWFSNGFLRSSSDVQQHHIHGKLVGLAPFYAELASIYSMWVFVAVVLSYNYGLSKMFTLDKEPPLSCQLPFPSFSLRTYGHFEILCCPKSIFLEPLSHGICWPRRSFPIELEVSQICQLLTQKMRHIV